jgi:hypothetical protein
MASPAGRTVTMSTAGNRGRRIESGRWPSGGGASVLFPRPRCRGVLALLVALFVSTQITALAHEIEHVLDQHGAPCALHVVAEYLAMASPPGPTLAVAPAPGPDAAPQSIAVATGRPACPSGARAPPRPS